MQPTKAPHLEPLPAAWDAPRDVSRIRRSLAPFGLFVPLLRPSPAAAGLPARRGRTTSGEVRRSLHYSIAEGMVAEAFTACTSNAMLTAWAVALDCGALLIGLLWALPYLAQLVQFPAAWLTSRVGGRKTAIAAVALSRQLQLPLVLLPFLPAPTALKQALFVGVTGLAALLGVIGNNGWTTWMGELVPARLSGRYFGRRTAICTLAGTFGALGAGLFIDAARKRGLEREGLAAIALFACLLGAVTTALMRRQAEPPRAAAQDLPSWSTLLEPWRDPAVRRALTFNLWWNAAVGLAASFFQIHMAKNLEMSFLVISAYCAATAVVRMLVSPGWGAALDRVGSKPVLVACTLGISTIPAIWIFAAPGTWWPIAIDVLVGAALWAGFNQAIFQLPLRVTPRKNRAFHLAAFSTAGGLAFALSSTAAGAVAQAMPEHFLLRRHAWTNYEVLFAVSSLARFAAGLLALKLVEPGARAVVELWRPAMATVTALATRRQGAEAGESTPARMVK